MAGGSPGARDAKFGGARVTAPLTFDGMPQLTTGAVFSPCRTWRYSLQRSWSTSKRLVVIGLNPSTADESKDDPTIRRCIGFAKRWGCGGLLMLNLFAFRATDPRELRNVSDPIGPENDGHLQRGTAGAPIVLAAWGAEGALFGRSADVRTKLYLAGVHLFCLGTTAEGEPRHPLYLRGDTPLVGLS